MFIQDTMDRLNRAADELAAAKRELTNRSIENAASMSALTIQQLRAAIDLAGAGLIAARAATRELKRAYK